MSEAQPTLMGRTTSNPAKEGGGRSRNSVKGLIFGLAVVALGLVVAVVDWQIQLRQREEVRAEQVSVLGQQLAGTIRGGAQQVFTVLRALGASSSHAGVRLSEDWVRGVLDDLQSTPLGFMVRGFYFVDEKNPASGFINATGQEHPAGAINSESLRELALEATHAAQVANRIGVAGPQRTATGLELVAVALPLNDSRGLVAILDLDAWMGDLIHSYGEKIVFQVSDIPGQHVHVLVDASKGADRKLPSYRTMLMTETNRAWFLEVWAREDSLPLAGVMARATVPLGFAILIAVLVGVLVGRHDWAEERSEKMTEVLAENRRRLVRALEVTQDGIWEFGQPGNRFTVSDRFADLLGLPAVANTPMRRVLRLLSKEERTRLLIALGAAWSEAGSVDELVHINHRSLGKRWIRCARAYRAERRGDDGCRVGRDRRGRATALADQQPGIYGPFDRCPAYSGHG